MRSSSVSPASTPSVRQVSVFAALKRLPPSPPTAFAPLRADVVHPIPGVATADSSVDSPEASAKNAGDASEEGTPRSAKVTSPSAKTDAPVRQRRVSFAKDTKSPKPTSLKELLQLSADSED
eukprot:s1374_g5.t1